MTINAEKYDIVRGGIKYTTILVDRKEYNGGTFERWETELGLEFACFIRTGEDPKKKNMVRVDARLYESPIDLGNNIFYLTDYWEGSPLNKYINTPIRFTPLQPMQNGSTNFNIGDVIVNRNYPDTSYVVEEIPEKCFIEEGPAYALSLILPNEKKGPVYVYGKEIVEGNYIRIP